MTDLTSFAFLSFVQKQITELNLTTKEQCELLALCGATDKALATVVNLKLKHAGYGNHFDINQPAPETNPISETSRIAGTLLETSVTLLNKQFGPNYAKTNPNVLSNVLNTHRSVYLSLQTKV